LSYGNSSDNLTLNIYYGPMRENKNINRNN
jgi:hypothetical protein